MKGSPLEGLRATLPARASDLPSRNSLAGPTSLATRSGAERDGAPFELRGCSEDGGSDREGEGPHAGAWEGPSPATNLLPCTRISVAAVGCQRRRRGQKPLCYPGFRRRK